MIKLICYIIFFLIYNNFAFANQCTSIPIEFINDLPYINIEIENQNLKLLFDTGAKSEDLVLDNSIIRNINNITIKKDKRKSVDLIGKIYEVDQYNLPKMKIGNISFNDVNISEYQIWGINISDGTENKKDQGVVGLNLFKNKIIIIDYIKSLLTIIEYNSNCISGYESNYWNKIGDELTDEGIIFNNFINNRYLSFILDTGANISIMKSAKISDHVKYNCDINFTDNHICKYIEINNFYMGNFNQKFYIYDFDGLSSDGLLGYDFLKNKIIFVDLIDNIVKISYRL